MRIHPAAKAIPEMTPDEFAALKADIAANGLLVPVETLGGQLIDGRHRLRACKELGIEPSIVEVELGKMTPANYVWSVNGVRRHLTPSQRAAVAVELLPELKKAAKERQREHGGTAPGRGNTGGTNATSDSGKARDQAADLVGVSARYVSDAETLQQEEPDLFQEVKDGKVTVSKAKREAKKRKAAKKRTTPVKPDANNVQVLLADPPWQYDFAETDNRNVENQYPTATPEAIGKHLGEWGPGLSKDCVLFLWATAPKLREAIQVMEAWGFEYKTHAVWDKERMGMGYWFRGQHELLLVGTRGAFSPPTQDARVSSVFRERRANKHSKKPVCVYEAIERMFPNATRFEMYQREPREGWLGGGNESHTP